MIRSWFAPAGALSLVALAGCSASTASLGGPFDGGVDETGSAETGGKDAASPVAPPLPAFKSDPPGIVYLNAKPSAAPGLELVSLRFTEEPSGGETFQKFFGEVRNVGSKPYCYPRLQITLFDVSGTEKASSLAYADAFPYDSGSSTSKNSMPCIAPGGRGAFYDNGFVTTPAKPDTVRRISVEFAILDSPGAVPDPASPEIATSKIEEYVGGYRLSGILRARQTISNVGLHVYPMVGGIPYEQLITSNLETIAKDATWSYATNVADAPFTEFLAFTSYIRGATSALWLSGPAEDLRVQRELVAANAREHLRRVGR